MSARASSLAARVEQYLAERRRLGFQMKHMGQALGRFARYVKATGHRGPLTVDLMASWARQVKSGQADRIAAARALRMLRPFMRWLQQFDPSTELPDEATFGSLPGRLAPHIFTDEEIAALLKAAAQIGPAHSLRGTVIETLLGLIASTGLRISEALALTDADVDLKAGVVTIRRSKFGKSRLVPLHPSVLAALKSYHAKRARYVPAHSEQCFFIATRGRSLGNPISDRQAHRIFEQLRRRLRWAPRGGHAAPRIHDLRHSFAVHRLMRWHEQGVEVHQHMLALSTYLGHAKISNTYWYLPGVPELMRLVGKRFEHFVDPWHGDSGESGDG